MVDNVLNRTPKGRDVNNFFNKLYLKNQFDNLIRDGYVDVDYGMSIKKNKQQLNAIERAGGSQAMEFVNNIDKFSNSLRKQLNFELKNLSSDIYKNKGKYGLAIGLLSYFGVPVKGIGALAAAKIAPKFIKRMMQNKDFVVLLNNIREKKGNFLSNLRKLNEFMKKNME